MWTRRRRSNQSWLRIQSLERCQPRLERATKSFTFLADHADQMTAWKHTFLSWEYSVSMWTAKLMMIWTSWIKTSGKEFQTRGRNMMPTWCHLHAAHSPWLEAERLVLNPSELQKEVKSMEERTWDPRTRRKPGKATSWQYVLHPLLCIRNKGEASLDTGTTPMFKLEEFRELEKQDGVERVTFAQCQFGCEFEKLTDLLANFELGPEFRQLCNHPPKWWRVPWSGKRIYAPHPPLRGKQLAIEEHLWNPGMLRSSEPQGDYLTRSAAAYPADLDRALAVALATAVQKTQRPVRMDRGLALQEYKPDPKPEMALKLGKQTVDKTQEEDRNSLRNVTNWVNDKMKLIGVQVRNIIETALDLHPDVEDSLWRNISENQKPEEITTPDEWLTQVRIRVADLFSRNLENFDSKVAVEQQSGTYTTKIHGRLLKAWSDIVSDPGAEAVPWLYQGAPAGLSLQSTALDGMFPQVAEDSEMDEVSLDTDFDTFQNYAGVEEDDEAYAAIESYCNKGFVKKFDSLEEVESELGAKPTLSKLGCIKKQKFNPETGQYTHKARIILDCKQSGVSRKARRTHKSVLPRATDAVGSALYHMSRLRPDQQVQLFIADIVDAFWLIPLHVSERQYFCAYLKGTYYVFTRTAQGSRMAPLSFAAIMSVAARWVQSLSDEFSMQVYVDDPLVVMGATEQRTKRLACLIAAAWQIMGFPLAFHKAQLSHKLVWIGVQLEVTSQSVIAEVPESKVAELIVLLKDNLQGNLITIKNLRSITGKVMSIASVIQVWRPFVQQLYVAMHSKESKAPKGCIWTKQISHTFTWLLAFLDEEKLGIRREFTLAAFLRRGPLVVITWDASPYGMGATLQIGGEYRQFFAIPITQGDQDILQTPAGDCKGQQVWEAFTGLIALRVWSKHWQQFPVILQVRNDNMGALTLFATLKASSTALSIIAREFALDLGRATCKPSLVQHIPGLSNTVCDMLSRRFDSKAPFKLPRVLLQAKAIVPPPRHMSWWKSFQPASSRSSPAMPCAAEGGDRSRSPRRIS